MKGISICLSQEVFDKISYIAKYENRSVSSQIRVFVREDIAKFEEAHGKIADAIGFDVNGKPPQTGST